MRNSERMIIVPEAKYRKVIANFNPWYRGYWQNVSTFVSLGARRLRSSWNISGSILRKFLNERTSSSSKSAIRWVKSPVLLFSPAKDAPTQLFSVFSFSALFCGAAQLKPSTYCSDYVADSNAVASWATAVDISACGWGYPWCTSSEMQQENDEDWDFISLYIQHSLIWGSSFSLPGVVRMNPGLIRGHPCSSRVIRRASVTRPGLYRGSSMTKIP